MTDPADTTIARVEREVGELPGSVAEALLAFCDGRRLDAVAADVFDGDDPDDDVDAAIERLDALSFDDD